MKSRWPSPRQRRVLARALLVLVAISALNSCRQPSSKTATRRDSAGPTSVSYVPIPGAVKLDILPVGGSETSPQWLASYTDEEGTTKFRIELGQQGKFLAETGSNPLPLLGSLKTALGAKRMPQNVQQADVLPFDYEVLGEDETRSPDGSFTDKPPGTWTALKIFLGKGRGEVYLNLNLAEHQGEFSIKDPAYGDIVLAELARVF